jgi:hypothetical protein
MYFWAGILRAATLLGHSRPIALRVIGGIGGSSTVVVMFLRLGFFANGPCGRRSSQGFDLL